MTILYANSSMRGGFNKLWSVLRWVCSTMLLLNFYQPTCVAGADPGMEDAFKFDETPGRSTGFGRYQSMDSRRSSRVDDVESHIRAGRKRPRARHLMHDDDDAPMIVSSRRGIKIGDEKSVWNFYEQRLKNCQQNACKIMAKAWVKAVEPKKQTNHPYTGSDQKAPGWWPKPWGPTKEEKVRHKEPDHLYKPGRHCTLGGRHRSRSHH